MWNVGGSGSLDSKYEPGPPHNRGDAGDGAGLRTFQDMIRHGMEREAAEEISATIGPGQSRTWLTGYARYLDRGGKPEFFGITRTTSQIDELRPTKRDKDRVHQIYRHPFQPTVAGLAATIEALLAGPDRGRFCLSMVVSLQCAKEYLARGGAIEF